MLNGVVSNDEIDFLSAEHTMEIGARIGSFLQKGDVIALEGTLAAGKTTLTRESPGRSLLMNRLPVRPSP